MAKIYVSSTYLDLQEFREKILFHLQRMKQAITAMEYYLADDRRPADKCIADVEVCDIYVGIFAWRYGTIPQDNNPDKLSITEMEYQAARKKRLPCLIFLHDGKSLWSPDLVDDDKTQVKAFRKKTETDQMVQWFKTADELASLVGASLYDKLIALGYGAPEKGLTDFDLDKYYTALHKRYGILALEGLTPPQKEEYLQIQLRSVFVEQSVRENPPPIELPKEIWEKLSREKEIHLEDLPSGITLEDVRNARDSYYEKPTRPALDVLTDSRHQYTIILGDPGSGKSTLARYVILSLIDSSSGSQFGDQRLQQTFGGYIPLLIELRSYIGLCENGRCTTVLEYLEYLGKTEGWHLTQTELHDYLKNNGRAVVIFDGLDEIFDPEQREQITRQIVGLGNDYPKVSIIVTSRVIGYRRKILTDAGFTHFMLQDLDENKVESFVTQWYALAMSDRPAEALERRERILRSFRDSSSIRQLAGNPMLLTIMTIIGKHQELPRERWKLYDHAASVLIQHWGVNKHLKDNSIQADFIGEDDKQEFLRRLAFRMQGGDGGLAGNYIHLDALQDEFEGYLIERYNQTIERAKVIAEAMIQQFRERNFILSLYGANLYGFVHRAFLEYFCASAFVYKFEKTKELTIEQLKNDVFAKHWEDQSWHEVLRLICGMIDEKWAGEIIEHLLNQVFDDWQAHIANRIPWNIALAVQCLSEIRNISAIPNSATSVLNAVVSVIELEMSESSSNYFQLGEHLKFVNQTINQGIETLMYFRQSEDEILEWLNQLKPLKYSWIHAETFGKLVGKITGGQQKVYKILMRYLTSNHEEYRVLVPYTLAIGWHDNAQTFTLLCECVRKDNYEYVRSAAVNALAQYYREEPESCVILREWATESQHTDVRSAAMYALANHYHEDLETLPFLRERAIKDIHAYVRRAALDALVQHYRKSAVTLPLLRECAVEDSHGDVRLTAMTALAQYYANNPETLPFLRERVSDDNDEYVRSAAVNALAQYYREEPESCVILRDWAAKSQHTDVRRAAVYALANHCHGDLETLSFLRECAAEDKHEYVRRAALDALVQHYHEDLETLPFLRERAFQDKHEYVRRAVLDALVQHYPENPETLPLLRKRAVEDKHEYVRRLALDTLIQRYRDDPNTFSLVLKCAVNDESPESNEEKQPGLIYVRQIAIDALAKYWSKKPDTLAVLQECADNDPTAWLRDHVKDLIEILQRKESEV